MISRFVKYCSRCKTYFSDEGYFILRSSDIAAFLIWDNGNRWYAVIFLSYMQGYFHTMKCNLFLSIPH